MTPFLKRGLSVLCLLTANPVLASDLPVTELQTIIITPASTDGRVFTVPHGVSVITAADIENSPASNLGELLSREANLNLKSFFGNDKNASVDIRGMGDTAVSNVLILVDGVRLNEADLSGADLSSIALSQIKRVEIIRGGGAVRYGDGAVGGVINIITQKPTVGPIRGTIAARLGSYGRQELSASAGGGKGAWRARATLSQSDNDGYRENSELDRRDGSIELRYLPTEALSFLELYGRISMHRDEYGLPGPVSTAAFATSDATRRQSNTPFDGGSTDDRMVTLGANFDFDTAGQLELLLNWRDRENPYIIGYSPLISLANQQNRITSQKQEAQLRYNVDVDYMGYKHTFGLGGHWQTADYVRYENGEIVVENSTRREGELTGTGQFAEAILRGPHGLAVNAGLRANRLESRLRNDKYTRECDFIFIPFPVPINCVDALRLQNEQGNTWHNQAYELGLTWQTTPNQIFFASASKHFRAPNIDELVLASDELRPQTGLTTEIGMRHTRGKEVELALTLFNIEIDDEIYYGQDPVSGASLNRNYEQATRRRGVEIQARWQLNPHVRVSANGGYVQPRFVGSAADIPHVARLTASTQVEWSVSDKLRLIASARHVSRRYDGNDINNTDYPILPAYTVYDLAARWYAGDVELSAAVNNLSNEVYSTVSYSATYYPIPGRNFTLGLRWRF